MKNHFLIQTASSLLVLSVAILLLNPFHFWMPTMAHMAVLACLFIALVIFAVFIFREKPRDERDEKNQAHAGNVGYVTAVALLVIGIGVESYNHMLTLLPVVTLGGMLFSYMLVRLYLEYK